MQFSETVYSNFLLQDKKEENSRWGTDTRNLLLVYTLNSVHDCLGNILLL